jgi:hypothetical protein
VLAGVVVDKEGRAKGGAEGKDAVEQREADRREEPRAGVFGV